MTDYFELLGLPRRAALDAGEVRAAFQRSGAAQHPDHAREPAERGARAVAFQSLQEAYAALSSTPRRLRHLLELHGRVPARAEVMDDALMPHFTSVHALLQQADALLAQKSAATTPLAKALLTAPSLEMEASLAAAAGALLERTGVLHGQLAAWDAAPPDWEALASVRQASAFLEKWEAQLQQRRLSLLL